MAHLKDEFRKNKISREFAARLSRLGPQQKVRAIVLFRLKDAKKPTSQRQSRADRQAAVEAMRESTKQALGDIDNILKCFGGHRLAKSPDALGSVSVETTAGGVNALAASEWVKAIMEDQAIYSML